MASLYQLHTIQTDLIEQNLLARFEVLAEAPGARLLHEPSYRWFQTDIAYPNPVFGCVLRARFPDRARAGEAVDRVIRAATIVGMPVQWSVDVGARRDDLSDVLRERGFRRRMAGDGMVARLDGRREWTSAASGVQVERVRTPAQIAQFVRVLAANADAPPKVEYAWRQMELMLGANPYSPRQRFLGLLEGRPVATAELISGAGVAGLYHVATLPAARGRGIASLLTQAAMYDGFRQGHDFAVLISTPMGRGVYERLGFETVSRLDFYGWSPAGEVTLPMQDAA